MNKCKYVNLNIRLGISGQGVFGWGRETAWAEERLESLAGSRANLTGRVWPGLQLTAGTLGTMH